jgi:hypothetical protein
MKTNKDQNKTIVRLLRAKDDNGNRLMGEDVPDYAAARIEELESENKQVREALSQVAASIGNGNVISPDASLELLCEFIPNMVRLCCARI